MDGTKKENTVFSIVVHDIKTQVGIATQVSVIKV